MISWGAAPLEAPAARPAWVAAPIPAGGGISGAMVDEGDGAIPGPP